MLNNQLRRQLLERHKQSGFPGSIIDVYKAYEQGVDIISNFEQQQMQQPQVAQTPQQQQAGLRPFHQAGNTSQSMVFPNVPPNTPFNTVGMKAPINIEKYDKQGHLVKSYENVPPGIENLPTGPSEGTILETPANMQSGGIKPAPRMGTRKNADGTESTHLYATETLDGKNWVAFPTLFQNPDSSWIDMSGPEWYPAYQEALKRGEVIDFGKRKNKALKWGEGSWKDSMQSGGQLPPIYTDNLNDPALIAYRDSSNLHNAMLMQDLLMGPNPKSAPSYNITWTPRKLREYRTPQWNSQLQMNISQDWESEKEMMRSLAGDPSAKANQKLIKYYKSLGFTDANIMYHTSPDVVHPTIRAIGTYHDGEAYSPVYKQPIQPIIYRETPPLPDEKLIPSTPTINSDPLKTTPIMQANVALPKPSGRKAQPIMRADFSKGIARQGQYQIGERYWDDDKKRWKEDRWSPEEIKESRRIAIEGLKPPGEYIGKFEFGYGGKRKYQSGGSDEQLYPEFPINLLPAEIVANIPEAPSEKIPWYSTINFRKWGLRDYGDDVKFGKAFRDAFNRGEEQFVWRGDRFTTKMKETAPEPVVSKQKQPAKPFKNEYDPFSPMGVASFLGNKYDGAPEIALALADTVGYHESDKGMDPKQKQHNNGPGRGLYQIEPKSMGTYIQRAKNYAAANNLKVPDWIMNAPEDASELTRDQQTTLFLINMGMHPNTNMRKYFSGDMSTEDMWMAGWKEKPAVGGTDRNAFKTSIKSAEQLGIPNQYSTQPPPPKIQPSPPPKEDELPSRVITPPPGLQSGGFKYPRYPKKVSYNNKVQKYS